MQSSLRVRKRKLKSEINVVPYIDVMLVLLIIFMVTAPLLNLGVDIQLPQSAAKAITTDKRPVVVEVTEDGKYFLDLGGGKRQPVDAEQLKAKVAAVMRVNPHAPVFISGDKRANYDVVYRAMVLLQQAGVPKVGLASQPDTGATRHGRG
ncbi:MULTISPECIES: protein TolR [Metallibacterium]|jgi:biopolymer transport protein TolR|uniref:protein TolR n=1 Tax=Metallibacterium TaxID=1218803 RepID=UPI002623C2BB|nr:MULTISPECIES: protein TolR [Metallibacterium]MBW8075215.1 protein TolR [Metallibacterium scheffleri]